MKHALAALCLTAACAAHAQGNTALTGAWNAQWQTPAGRPATATLELRDGAGTWKPHPVGRVDDPCIRLPAPAKVVIEEEQPHVSITPSAVIGGCRDSLMKLTAEPDGTLRGTWRDGRQVTLTKR